MNDQALAKIILPGMARSVSLARRWVVDALTTAGHKDVDGAQLVTSELVGNAIQHTGSGRSGGLVTVTIYEVCDDLARIEVIDEGASTVPKPRESSEDDCCGRGLWLVQQTSIRWGTRPVPMRWNLVWAEVLTLRADHPSDVLNGNNAKNLSSNVKATTSLWPAIRRQASSRDESS
ncbi:ATP-binding protein [Nonomuraea jabiensis]|uniref:ATP-binding protein n=1 Tax=Nonomuraea jabiensis TaxID=882448 RepID=UPI003674A818